MKYLIIGLATLVVSYYLPAQNNFLDFDGINDHIIIPTSSSLELENGDLTIEFWMRALPGGQIDFADKMFGPQGSHSGILLHTVPDGRMRFCYANQSINSRRCFDGTTNLHDSQWHHFAIVKSGNTITMFVDGVNDNASFDHSGTMDSSTPTNLNIGKRFNNTDFHRGQLDEYRIWNIARSQIQIQGHINQTLNGNEQGLVAYYNFNQGICGGANPTQSTIIDFTTNNNNGSLQNFSLSGCSSNWVCAGATCNIPNYLFPPTPVPTISQWGLIILGLIILCLGAISIHQYIYSPSRKILDEVKD